MDDEQRKQLERKRAAARGWTTRSSKALSALVNKAEVTKMELEDAIGDFDRRLAALDDVQSEVELAFSEPDKQDEDIEAADHFRRQVRGPRVQAAQKLADLLAQTDPLGESAQGSVKESSVSVTSNVRLPRIELPKFRGDVLEWLSFWEQFEALVGDSNIPAVNKFGYLYSSLEGEAKRVLQGLTLTASNYPIACDMLKERFGKPERIIFAHIQALLNINMPTKSSGSKYIASLWKMQDQLNTHVRSLEALGVKGGQYGVVLTPVILSRLPQEIRMEWSRDGSGHEGDLSWLMTFLQKEIERRERSHSYRDSCCTEETRSGPLASEKRKVTPGTASVLVSSSAPVMTRCVFCGKSHPSEKCFSLCKLTRAELEDKVRSFDLCFRCFNKGHTSKGCKSKCSKCRGNHNVLFCLKDQPRELSNSVPCNSDSTEQSSEKATVASESSSNPSLVNHVGVALCKAVKGQKKPNSTCCVLQSAKVKVINNEGKGVQATVLFDNGSDRSYVSSSLIKKIKPAWVCSEPLRYSAFGNKCSQSQICNLYDLKLEDCKGFAHSLVAAEVPTICAPLIRPSVPKSRLKAFESLHLADDYLNNHHLNVDILVGVDSYWNFMLPNQVCQYEGLVAQESVFGWVLSGSWASCNEQRISTQLLCVNAVSESSLHKFWDLESVGILCKEDLRNEANCVQRKFDEHVKFVNGRYEVALPWKSDTARSHLQNNVKLAEKRLHNLCRKFQNDEVLPDELLFKFQRWFNNISQFKSWKVPRCYSPGIVWRFMKGAELHAFGDASERGYGACVYLRFPQSDGKFSVSFVMSRGRVAPVKSVTLPRLELIGAVLCARLVTYVKSALRLEVPVYCWTDSTVTLHWIKGEPLKWKVFVRNRVSEIQELTSPSNWYHCPGKDNPADLISRGALAEHLMSNEQWLNGPAWLSFPLSHLLQAQPTPEEEIYEEEVAACLTVNRVYSSVFEFDRWGEFSKAIRVVAWVMRFINNCKLEGNKDTDVLTYVELSKAKVKLFQCVQREAYDKEYQALSQGKAISQSSSLSKLGPFIDVDGLLRIKGRLDQADMLYESKHPIIIPSGHIAKLLIMFQHTLLKHAGVSTLVSTLRSTYWVVGLRRMAKSICNKCVPCRRHHSKACTQPVAPLPALRVTPSPPFAVTGLDYAGPLFCVDKPSCKFYILLFTCAVIRAIHLELTDSLSMDDCTLALRRFAARRGLPSVFYSDNAQTFVGVSHKLKQMFGPLAPNWNFIVPRAAWWGGWWERLVRSVKVSLRKTLGVKSLSRNELETTLHEIEACINSRPLTYVGEECGNAPPLTPSHFLIGRPAGFKIENVNECIVQSAVKDLSVREQIRQLQLEKFWKMWSCDYIRNLPPAVKGFVPKCNLKEGSLVLIKEDNIPRMSWPCGIVLQVFPGKDGLVRSVKLKTAKGIVQRPIQRLHDLEINNGAPCTELEGTEESSNKNNGSAQSSVAYDSCNVEDVSTYVEICPGSYTKRGRRVKRPVRMNL